MAEDAPKGRKRVIFVNRFYWPDESATAQILTDLAEHLAVSGWEVHVVTSRLRYETSGGTGKLPARESQRSVHIHRLWSTAFGRAGLAGRLADYLTIYFSFFLYLLRGTRPSDIVVLKTDPPLLSILGWIAGLFRPFNKVAWCQDMFPEVAEHAFPAFPGKRLLFGALKGLRDISLNQCDRVIAISDDMAQLVRARGVRQPIATIPNWAIQIEGGDGPDYAGLREEWGLADRFIVGYSGNLGRAHDVDTFIRALPELARLERLTLLFIGGGKGYRILQDLAGDYPGDLLRFLPYQPRKNLSQTLKVPHVHWFSLQPEMTAHVSPSKFYGILEAGRPMVFLGNPESALARSIVTRGCGLVVPSGDVDQLIRAVNRFFSDPKLLETSGSSAKGYASGVCSRSNRLHQWRKFLLTGVSRMADR